MEHIKLAYKLAWSYHQTTGLDIDDLKQEASLAYLTALKSYDPERGCITTHLWNVIQSHLRNYLKKERKYTEPLDSIDVLRRKPAYQLNFFECLSSEAQEVLNIITSGPLPYVTSRPSDAIRRIQEVMTQQGWESEKISRAIYDLELSIK